MTFLSCKLIKEVLYWRLSRCKMKVPYPCWGVPFFLYYRVFILFQLLPISIPTAHICLQPWGGREGGSHLLAMQLVRTVEERESKLISEPGEVWKKQGNMTSISSVTYIPTIPWASTIEVVFQSKLKRYKGIERKPFAKAQFVLSKKGQHAIKE